MAARASAPPAGIAGGAFEPEEKRGHLAPSLPLQVHSRGFLSLSHHNFPPVLPIAKKHVCFSPHPLLCEGRAEAAGEFPREYFGFHQVWGDSACTQGG